jgi:hypothetical protein
MKNNIELESRTSNASTTNEGLDFISCHFKGSIWPRTVSTAATYAAQILVFSEEEAAQKFAAANLSDCRINAYPAHTQYKGVNRQAPNFIFIDLDRSNFGTEKALGRALNRTLKSIRDLGAEPTVLWSGNGYHVYLPVEAFILEEEEIFAKFEQPSKKFLRFAARYLSSYKSDPNNNPSLGSCMVRIPGSFNSKHVTSPEVKIIQKWNGYRPSIRFLLGSFHAWLVDQQIKELEEQQKRQLVYQNFKCTTDSIQWIERLLLTPIPDYRKLAMWHILAPYLITKRGMSYDEAYHVIRKWLDKCNDLEGLNFNTHQKITWALKGARGFFPISYGNLKSKKERFYNLLKDHGVLTH